MEDLDFADNLAVMSSTSTLQEKSDRLSSYGKHSLYINQVMCINTPTTPPITIDGEVLECVGYFTYLRSLVSSESGTQKDIKQHLNKARGAFSQLHKSGSINNIASKLRSCSTTAMLRLLDGLQLGTERAVEQRPPGERQWWRSWRRWVFRGTKHRPKHETGSSGNVWRDGSSRRG